MTRWIWIERISRLPRIHARRAKGAAIPIKGSDPSSRLPPPLQPPKNRQPSADAPPAQLALNYSRHESRAAARDEFLIRSMHLFARHAVQRCWYRVEKVFVLVRAVHSGEVGGENVGEELKLATSHEGEGSGFSWASLMQFSTNSKLEGHSCAPDVVDNTLTDVGKAFSLAKHLQHGEIHLSTSSSRPTKFDLRGAQLSIDTLLVVWRSIIRVVFGKDIVDNIVTSPALLGPMIQIAVFLHIRHSSPPFLAMIDLANSPHTDEYIVRMPPKPGIRVYRRSPMTSEWRVAVRGEFGEHGG
ncbi:hypothetical protein KC357_g161 [Hortaea werneckii]|nr:hypothetical protein KC357_g161 [Hortaea werneckii]